MPTVLLAYCFRCRGPVGLLELRNTASQMTTENSPQDSPGNPRNVRLPMAICAAVAELLSGSHEALETQFFAAGAKGEPPNLAHHTKWKTWLYEEGKNPNCDSLAFLGHLIEEFMDLPPLASKASAAMLFDIEDDPVGAYRERRDRLATLLEQHGFSYFRGGRILPIGEAEEIASSAVQVANAEGGIRKPREVEELLRQVIRGIPRAMHPLTHRRRDATSLSFDNEYDIQDLLHSQLRPWIADIRAEEFTPSYAGSSTRMDFLLPAHRLVLEVKRVRTREHAKKIGDELIIDSEHYRKHPQCDHLWCVVYDPMHLLSNPSGLVKDLEGVRRTPDGLVDVRVFVFGAVI